MNNIFILNREFLNEAINGPSFSVAVGDNTGNLTANAGELSKLLTTVELSTTVSATPSYQIAYTDIPPLGSGQAKFFQTNINWSQEGFVVGESIKIEANSNTVTTTILSIQGSNIFVDNSVDITTALGIVSGDFRSDFVFKAMTAPTVIRYGYGIIQNSGPDSIVSPFSAVNQSYSSTSPISAVFLDLSFDSVNSANVGSVKARITSAVDGVFTIEVEHIFRVIPYSLDTYLTNFQSGVTPSEFTAPNSFRYYGQFQTGTNINNPNNLKTFSDNFELGSVGWRSQNFGLNPSNYDVQNVTFEDASSAPLQTIEATQTTTVKFQIKKLSGIFSIGQKIILYHSKLPTSSEYANSASDFEDIWIHDSIEQTEGDPDVDSTIINNLIVDINVDNTLLDVEFDIIYNNAEEALINNQAFFELAVGVWDSSLSAEASDRTIETVAFGNWSKSTDLYGLITENELIYYRSNEIIGVDAGTGNFSSWNQSIWTLGGSFKLTKSNGQNTMIDSIKHSVVAYKAATNEFFIIDEYNFPFAPVNIVKGNLAASAIYQAVNVATTRNLGIPSSDQISRVILNSEVPAAFQNSQLWEFQVGFKVSWRDWEPLVNVPAEFYQAVQPNQGFNKKTSNYSDKEDYQIFGFVTVQTRVNVFVGESVNNKPVDIGGGTVTQYNLSSLESRILDFEEDNNDPVEWLGEVEIYDKFNALSDEIFSNQDMKIKAIMKHPDIGTVYNVIDMFGELRIEVNLSSDTDRRLSTLGKDWSESNNMLKPLLTFANVQMTQNNLLKEIYLECLTEKSNIPANVSFNISAELIGLVPISDPNERITEDGQTRFLEDNQIRVIE